jgi:hypothetical protein
MPFTATEREHFTNLLKDKGWAVEKDTLWSPSRGLYFNDSHFAQWSAREMHDVFTRRGERIQEAALDGWERSVGEHRDVCSVAQEVFDA